MLLFAGICYADAASQKSNNQAVNTESTDKEKIDSAKSNSAKANSTKTDSAKSDSAKSDSTSVTKYDKDNQKVFELLADNVYSADNTIYAVGHAILINHDIYTLADLIQYDMEKREVQASGDVRIYRDENLLVRTQSTFFKLDEHYGVIEPLYLQDTKTGMWVSSKSGLSNNGIYSFKKATISGCSIQKPIWRMEATSGSYSDESKNISMWNPRVYIGDVPILYFPYFRVSTDMSRKSGLLMPDFVQSATDGFIYMQPYYLAPKSNWDMTFTPQVRTQRGVGGMIEFRALDSKLDRTYAEFGYFYNFREYSQQYNVKNRRVFGGRLYHLSNKPLQKFFKLKSDLDNGFYINFAYMNDLDYYRLRQVYRRVYDNFYTSKANAFIQTDKHYFGLNLKYFLNLSAINNSTTLQSLPNMQYHKYMDSLFFRQLLYSIDYQFRNTTRDLGYGYVENSLRIPIGLQFSLLKKYISLGVWSEFYAENLAITQTKNSYIPTADKNGNIFSANYSISLNSDLSKSHDKFFHSVQFEALLSGPYLFYHNGLLSQGVGDISAQVRQASIALRGSNPAYSSAAYLNKFPMYDSNGVLNFYDDIWDPSGISAYSIINQTLDLKLTQYFITNAGRSIFDWRIYQRLNFDELSNTTLNADAQGRIDPSVIAKRPLESKFNFTPINNLSITTSFFYSFYTRKMSELAITASYNQGAFRSSASYYYKDKEAYDFLANTLFRQTGAHYLRGTMSHDFRVFAFSASAGYDIEKNTLLDWDIGLYKNIRCFGVGLKFVNRRLPILTNNTANPYYIQQDYYVRLILNFVPLNSVGFTTRFYR
ncbi:MULTISPECIES: LPS-assembly protein LptD [unclassified Helicobacter]|uniref:LPS-assembly protein LptD n=1 Tax=unclassified Helicobacter TaxID=2593540 RepID=UPI001315A03F|nr:MULTISPECIES: LPS assembly protein LptD [unclassified Helicobacter]